MKLYLIQCSKTGKTYSQFTNMKEAKKELSRMNKGETEICSSRGVELPYRIEVDEFPYIAFMRNKKEEFIFVFEYGTKEDVKKYAKFFNKSDIDNVYYFGIKDYIKELDSEELIDNNGNKINDYKFKIVCAKAYAHLL